MKKSNMLIAVFAVLAAASVAKAGEFKAEDGMRELNVFARPGLEAPAVADKKINWEGGNTCCGMPIGPHDLCMMVCPFPDPLENGGLEPAVFSELLRYRVAQEEIKKAVAEHYNAIGDQSSALALADKNVRVVAERGSVLLFKGGSQERIADRALAARVNAIVHPEGQQKIVMEGTAIIIGCMSSKDCWDAVGDGVSAVSEWLNS